MAKKSLKERIKERREKMNKGDNDFHFIFLKDKDEVRIRLAVVEEESDFIAEVQQFYLGAELKGVLSPASFGRSCALMEYYDKLKASKDTADKKMLESFYPRTKGVIKTAVVYKDSKGKEIDTDRSGRFMIIANGIKKNIYDYYLDEEWGDMTSAEDGYDLKLGRTGSGLNDTEYSCNPCKPTECPDGYDDVIDLEEEILKIMPTYEETHDILVKYLGGEPDSDDDDDEEEEERPRKKRIKRKK